MAIQIGKQKKNKNRASLWEKTPAKAGVFYRLYSFLNKKILSPPAGGSRL